MTEVMGFLPPFIREDPIMLQEAGQMEGWQITAFNLPDVWHHSRGKGVTIAVLDSGADLDHPDLQGNLLPGVNFVPSAHSSQDDNCHGSHVSGIIAAVDNDIGIIGVAPESKILPIKVLAANGAGRMSDVVQGIHWAVDNGADLISMSLGTRNPLDDVHQAILYAASKNVVCFVAAGNAGSTEHLLYPAAYPETISIGAIDEQCFRADFSCTGPNLDFVAPGVRIYSTVPKGEYAFLSGTSMAAPFCVGVAALVLSHKRETDPTIRLSAEDYRIIFRENTMDAKNLDAKLDQVGKKFFQGFGIIQPNHFGEWVMSKI